MQLANIINLTALAEYQVCYFRISNVQIVFLPST